MLFAQSSVFTARNIETIKPFYVASVFKPRFNAWRTYTFSHQAPALDIRPPVHELLAVLMNVTRSRGKQYGVVSQMRICIPNIDQRLESNWMSSCH